MRPETTQRRHSPQLDLPGQTHVAEGPHDQTGMYVMHFAFRRDLVAFQGAVRHTPLGDAATWHALSNRWARFASVLHHHHNAEDEAYWPLLAQAVAERGTPGDQLEVEAMSTEHAAIDPELEACREAFAGVLEHPCQAHRNALDIRVTGLHQLLSEHLRHEETIVLPMLQRIWTSEEFAAAEKGVQKHYPAKDAPFIVAWAMWRLPDSARDRMFHLAGPGYAVLHRLVRRRFARRELAAFRYADPLG